MKVLIRMRHGLGDNAQFTIVLRHIKHYFPHWKLDLEVKAGVDSYFRSMVDNLIRRQKVPCEASTYDKVFEVVWPVPKVCKPNLPSTKPTRYLEEVLKVEPIESLYRGYEIQITEQEKALADAYVASLPDRPFVLIHYLAATMRGFKNLNLEQARRVCDCIQACSCVPVVLDWKGESPLPDGKTVFNPSLQNPLWQGQRSSSAGTLAALIQRARLCVGIDSGPLHVAGATHTPSIGVWRGHHPVNFFDLCENVIHLVPRGTRTIKGEQAEMGKAYFERAYRFKYYDHLSQELGDLIKNRLEIKNIHGLSIAGNIET